MQLKQILGNFKVYIILTIGIFLYCFSWTAFLIPNGVSGGGVTGIATVLYYAIGWPVSYSYIIINVFLVIMGTIILGKGFGFKTIYCIVLASIFLEFLPLVPWHSQIEEKFLNAIIGGTMSGLGIAMIFIQGGSTGGTDILAIIIAKYREASPGRVFLICDLLIIGSIILLPNKNIEDVIYGYIQMVSFSYIVDLILTGNKQSVQILVFSAKFKEIADMIAFNMKRGVTALNSVGWYSQQDNKVLIIIARKQQLPQITSAIKEIDNQAFLSVTNTMSVYGNGFDQIKNKGSFSWKKAVKKS